MTIAIYATFVHASTLGDDEVSIVEHLHRKGNIKVENPSTLNDRLNKSISENNDTIDAEPVNRIVSGYRVQVFSDNNSRLHFYIPCCAYSVKNVFKQSFYNSFALFQRKAFYGCEWR